MKMTKTTHQEIKQKEKYALLFTSDHGINWVVLTESDDFGYCEGYWHAYERMFKEALGSIYPHLEIGFQIVIKYSQEYDRLIKKDK